MNIEYMNIEGFFEWITGNAAPST